MIIYLFLIYFQIVINAAEISLQVNEDEPVGHVIGEISPDQTARYILPETKYFKLDDKIPNKILIKNPLDRDKDSDLCKEITQSDACIWSGMILVNDSDFIMVKIVINDVNDNTPSWHTLNPNKMFDQKESIIRLQISENTPVGQSFDLPMAVDPDSGTNSIVSYDIVRDFNYDSMFSLMSVETSNGLVPRLILNKPLDHEVKSEYNLTITAKDGPGKIGSAVLMISVIDENDNRPEFESTEDPFVIRIDEDLKINSKLPRHPIAKDKDSGRLGTIRYKFSLATKENVRRDFSIDQNTGDIIVRNNLDYDAGSNREYSLVVIAEDGGNPALSSETLVSIIVQDVNDNMPSINLTPISKSGKLEIDEEVEPEKLIATITVSDLDSGVNGEFSCSLMSGDNFRLKFIKKIDKMTLYQLLTRKKFNRESEGIVRDTLICSDKGDKPQIAKKYLQVEVLDKNDNPPEFNTRNFSFQFSEGNKQNQIVGQVRAQDKDISPNNNIEYELVWPPELGEQVFNIDSEGNIFANQEIDREKNPKGYTFQIIARDPSIESFKDSVYVEIALKDVNDCTPEFVQPTYHFSVEENDKPIPTYEAVSNTLARPHRRDVGKVKATDCDMGMNSEIIYTILNQDVPFDIDNEGNIFLTGQIDREKTPAYLLTIVAKDTPKLPNGSIDERNQLSSQVKVNVVITDVNDNPPKFIFPSEVKRSQSTNLHTSGNTNLPSGSSSDLINSSNLVTMSFHEKDGFHIVQVVAEDPDSGENRRISYSIIRQTPNQNIFRIDENKGDVFLSRKLTFNDLGLFKLSLSASDHGNPEMKSYSELFINVTDQEPVNNIPGGTYRTGNFFTSFFTRDKIIIVGIISATIIISTALIMIICLVFRGCPKSKSSWAETRRSLVLGRGFNPEDMINGYHGNTLSSFDFPSDSDNNLTTESNKDHGLMYSNGLHHQQLPTTNKTVKKIPFQSSNSPTYYYKPMSTGGYNTLRSFSPSIISTNQYVKGQNPYIHSPSLGKHNFVTSNIHNNSSNNNSGSNQDQQTLIYPGYNNHGTESNELVFTNLENLTSTFMNSNDSTATTTNEGKSTSSDTMTKLSDRHFELLT